MTINKCVIVANGDINNIFSYLKIFREVDLIICADGGLKYLDEISIIPDVLVGDFDSVDKKMLDKYRTKNIKILNYPSRKNLTDSEIAIDYAINCGPKEVILLGFLGLRVDHTLSNIHMLKKFNNHKINAMIINDKNKIYYVNENIKINGIIGENLSIIPITNEVTGIKTIGLEYPLNNETLYFEGSRGVSNILSAEEVIIEIKNGEIFIIKSQD